MSRSALVTGGTGLVGSHIIELLAREGWRIRALVRDPARAAWLRGMGDVELVAGDVLDVAGFSAAARGCDSLFHTAAVITERGGWEEYRRVNVQGTAAAIEAAASSGARFLHLSSVAVYGSGRYRGHELTSESAPLGDPAEMAPYGRSKLESEALVLEAHAAGRIWATAVRPDVIYGRRDRQFVPRVARVLSRGVFPLIGGGRSTLAIVHAANVAAGAVLAVATAEAGGRAYNITSDDGSVTVAEFARLAASALGRRVWTPSLPASVAAPLLRGGAMAVEVVAGEGLATQARSSLAFLTRDNPFSSERARRELGWTPVISPADGIYDAFHWWRGARGRR